MRLKNTIGDVRIEVNTDRLDRRLERAQNALDQQVLGDMLPYTPFLQGQCVVQHRLLNLV